MDIDLIEKYKSKTCIERSRTSRQHALTLLFENSSFTPLPELMCFIVLYSPSSSSLISYNEADGDGGVGGGVTWEDDPAIAGVCDLCAGSNQVVIIQSIRSRSRQYLKKDLLDAEEEVLKGGREGVCME